MNKKFIVIDEKKLHAADSISDYLLNNFTGEEFANTYKKTKGKFPPFPSAMKLDGVYDKFKKECYNKGDFIIVVEALWEKECDGKLKEHFIVEVERQMVWDCIWEHLHDFNEQLGELITKHPAKKLVEIKKIKEHEHAASERG